MLQAPTLQAQGLQTAAPAVLAPTPLALGPLSASFVELEPTPLALVLLCVQLAVLAPTSLAMELLCATFVGLAPTPLTMGLPLQAAVCSVIWVHTPLSLVLQFVPSASLEAFLLPLGPLCAVCVLLARTTPAMGLWMLAAVCPARWACTPLSLGLQHVSSASLEAIPLALGPLCAAFVGLERTTQAMGLWMQAAVCPARWACTSLALGPAPACCVLQAHS